MNVSEPECNICGQIGFMDFRGRKNVLCRICGSLERHRMCFEVYKQEIKGDKHKRILHLAPERCLQGFFETLNCFYLTADANPSIYHEWARPLRLSMPEGLGVFTDGYFDYIVHNHVLEHLPGQWREHINTFIRCLNPHGGKMIFSVPGPIREGTKTIDGGEKLISDAERVRLFGQKDHYKKFGYDLIEFLSGLNGTNFKPMVEIPADVRHRHSAGERVMVLTRNIVEG